MGNIANRVQPETLGNYAHLVKAHVWAIIVHRDALWGLTNNMCPTLYI